jgi:hypothetical protein
MSSSSSLSKQIEKAKECLRVLKGPLINFSIIKEDLTYEEHLARVCHAAIGYAPAPDTKVSPPVIVATATNLENHNRHIAKVFLKWFVEESFASPFILNRDDLEEICDTGILVTTKIPTPLMQNILIMCRTLYECSTESLEMFVKLYNSGIEGHLAYSCCVNSSFSREGVGLNHTVAWLSGHRAWAGWSLETYRNVLENIGRLPAVPSYYEGNRVYTGGLNIFNNKSSYFTEEPENICKSLVLLPCFLEALSDYRKEKVTSEVYKPPNPFTRKSHAMPSLLQPDSMDYTELFEFALPWVKDNLELLGLDWSKTNGEIQ